MTTNRSHTEGGSVPAVPARIHYLRVQNYRALQHVEFKNITPLMVLLGPNGSGKSTVFDVFNFLSECFQHGLRHAWDRRGRARELKTRGQDGPVVIEVKYRERPKLPLITYHLAIDEGARGPFVAEEWLRWTRKKGKAGRPFKFLDYRQGKGRAISGEMPDADDARIETPLRSPDLIAVNTLGQFAEHPRVAALREFITDWYVSYLSIEDTRGQPEAGPQERLSKTGDNLPNVVQYLKEQHAAHLEQIFETLRTRVPRLERVEAEAMQDGRLLLQIAPGGWGKSLICPVVGCVCGAGGGEASRWLRGLALLFWEHSAYCGTAREWRQRGGNASGQSRKGGQCQKAWAEQCWTPTTPADESRSWSTCGACPAKRSSTSPASTP